jgi:serine/threonine protein kinase
MTDERTPPLLLERLRECELLEASQLQELAQLPEARDPNPAALGKILIQRGWLTRFQINTVANGRGKDLFVGPYLLLDRVGEGGMGQVYKAQHRHMSRVVALKVIRKEKLANPDAVKRFYQEVQAAAHLSHPNIVLAYDAGQAGSTHYLAMEYVEGDDLAKLVKEQGPLPVATACDYVRQAALGLQHAYEKGLVHRDIKPHNLLVSRGKENGASVKILDMGLARLQGGVDKDRALTQTGAVIGTPEYLSPEQAVNSRKADIRSDIYSLGCTLYFLLTGRPPFQGESLTQILLLHQTGEAEPLTKHRPGLPVRVQKVVQKMIAREPEERYQTPAEVALALEPLCREGVTTVPAAPATRSRSAAASASSARTLSGDEEEPFAALEESGVTQELKRGSGVFKKDSRPLSRKQLARPNPPLVLAANGGGAALLLLLVAGGVIWMVTSSRPKPKPPEEVPPS